MRGMLITRIKNIDQYNEKDGLVNWRDSTPNRWNLVYGKLKQGDRAIFILAGSTKKVLLTKIKEVNFNKSILCDHVESFSLGNDDFLRLNSIFGERASRVKANFQPFLFDHDINIAELRREAKNKDLVNFYILKSQKYYQKNQQKFKSYDRIVILDKLKISKIVLHNTDQKIQSAAIGKTIAELISIHQEGPKKKVNLIKQLQEIRDHIETNEFYQFKSFFMYYDVLFNKRAYLNRQKKVNERNPLTEKKQLKLKDEADINEIKKATSKKYTRLHNRMTNQLRELFDQEKLFEGEGRAMFDVQLDKFDGVNNLLIEVKSSAERAHVRMAIGQLLDYCFSLKEKSDRRYLAVLLPSKPAIEIQELLQWCMIGLLWFEKQYTQLATNTEWLKCIAKIKA